MILKNKDISKRDTYYLSPFNKVILLLFSLLALFCSNTNNADIINHINEINSPQALLNVHKFKEASYYSDIKEIEFAKAVAQSDRAKIDKLLKEGVNINSLGTDSISFLCWAFIKFQRNSFKYLLENGASVDLKLKQGNTISSFARLQKEKYYSDLIESTSTEDIEKFN